MKVGIFMHSLPQNLKKLRKEHKMTQQQIADYLNVSHTAYNFYENGKREPDLTNLLKLAQLFKTSTDYLLGRYDSEITGFNNTVTNSIGVVQTFGNIHTGR